MPTLVRFLRHGLGEALEGLWRNPGLTFLAAVSIGVALYVLGLFLVLAFNLNRFVEALGRDQQVQIYFRQDARPEEIESLRRELATDPAIAEARFVNAAEARHRFATTFPALKDLPDQLGGQPFPPSFELVLREGYREREALQRIAQSYGKAPGVDEVRYDLEWLARLNGIVSLVRRGGLGLGALLAGAVMVTVGAVVRLTVLARREEIEIMKLVGATAAFIRGPFVVGAAVQGFLGGALAAGGLFLTHRLLERSEVYRATPFLSVLAGRALPPAALALLAFSGALLGVLAAIVSLRRAGTY
jgi:cell division transport system permease protein